MWALAESGGRVSEVLSLNLSDLAPRDLQPPYRLVVRLQVVGKGQHEYQLRLHQALLAIADYVRARGAELRATGEKCRSLSAMIRGPTASACHAPRCGGW